MADRGVDLSALPKEVRDQLAELDLELSEGKASIRGAGRKFSVDGDGVDMKADGGPVSAAAEPSAATTNDINTLTSFPSSLPSVPGCLKATH